MKPLNTILLSREGARRAGGRGEMKVHYRSRLARALLPRRYLAITLGSHVLTREGDLDARVLRHERVHVEQWRRHGRLRFLARYLYCHFRYGYWDNPFEVEARRGEDPSHTDPAEISVTARKA